MYPAHGGGEHGYERPETLWRARKPQALGIKHNAFKIATTIVIIQVWESSLKFDVVLESNTSDPYHANGNKLNKQPILCVQ